MQLQQATVGFLLFRSIFNFLLSNLTLVMLEENLGASSWSAMVNTQMANSCVRTPYKANVQLIEAQQLYQLQIETISNKWVFYFIHKAHIITGNVVERVHRATINRPLAMVLRMSSSSDSSSAVGRCSQSCNQPNQFIQMICYGIFFKYYHIIVWSRNVYTTWKITGYISDNFFHEKRHTIMNFNENVNLRISKCYRKFRIE